MIKDTPPAVFLEKPVDPKWNELITKKAVQTVVKEKPPKPVILEKPKPEVIEKPKPVVKQKSNPRLRKRLNLLVKRNKISPDPHRERLINQLAYRLNIPDPLVTAVKPEPKKVFNVPERTIFYDSREWQVLRYSVLRKYGRKCMACSKTEGQMHVDHIKPRSRYPELELNFDNLQVLCRDCNMGKSAWDETDWREMREIVPLSPKDRNSMGKGFVK